MNLLMNPWMLLGLVMFWLVSVTSAFFAGEHVQQGDDALAQKQAIQQAQDDFGRRLTEAQLAGNETATAKLAAGRATAGRGPQPRPHCHPGRHP
jgi:hypothetical protein